MPNALPPRPLKMRDRRFIQSYFKCACNALAAFRDAFPGVAHGETKAYRILKKPEVRAEIERIYLENTAPPGRVLAETTEIALTPMNTPVNWRTKTWALSQLGKYHKLWDARDQEETPSPSSPINIAILLKPGLLERLEAIDAEVATESNESSEGTK